MSLPIRPTPPAVSTRARALAAQLAALFETDQEIVVALNDAHHRLAAANDRLRADPASDRLVVCEQVRHAFWAYQTAAERRRQLAVDVGELSQQLTDALTTAGHSPQQARSANVHELAAGHWQPTNQQQDNKR